MILVTTMRAGTTPRCSLLGRLLCGVFLVGACSPTLSRGAATDSLITAVYAKTTGGYKRTRLPDGSFKPEFYALSNGGTFPGTTRDRDMDEIFPKIADVLGRTLATQNYFLARDSKSADLLLLVHWGKTLPFYTVNYSQGVQRVSEAITELKAPGGDQIDAKTKLDAALAALAIQNTDRDRQMRSKAQVLGYVGELDPAFEASLFGVRADNYQEYVSDLEEDRYYVVVTACDFKETVAQKKPKPLWVTRMSIRARSTKFVDGLAAMMASAARRFGQDTGGLIRKSEEGRVEIGEPTVIGVLPTPLPASTPEKK